MRNGDSRSERGQGGPQRCGRISLHHNQVGRVRNARNKRSCDGADMPVGIRLAGAIEAFQRVRAEPELRRIKLPVLTGQDEACDDALGSQCMGYRALLDGFWPGSNDQSNIYAAQLPP
jgi:hypothetical protein